MFTSFFLTNKKKSSYTFDSKHEYQKWNSRGMWNILSNSHNCQNPSFESFDQLHLKTKNDINFKPFLLIKFAFMKKTSIPFLFNSKHDRKTGILLSTDVSEKEDKRDYVTHNLNLLHSNAVNELHKVQDALYVLNKISGYGFYNFALQHNRNFSAMNQELATSNIQENHALPSDLDDSDEEIDVTSLDKKWPNEPNNRSYFENKIIYVFHHAFSERLLDFHQPSENKTRLLVDHIHDNTIANHNDFQIQTDWSRSLHILNSDIFSTMDVSICIKTPALIKAPKILPKNDQCFSYKGTSDTLCLCFDSSIPKILRSDFWNLHFFTEDVFSFRLQNTRTIFKTTRSEVLFGYTSIQSSAQPTGLPSKTGPKLQKLLNAPGSLQFGRYKVSEDNNSDIIQEIRKKKIMDKTAQLIKDTLDSAIRLEEEAKLRRREHLKKARKKKIVWIM